MAFKDVEMGQATDIKKHKGRPYTGTYKDSKEITTKIGKQTIYNFEDPEGDSFSIYGFTNLNRAMEHVKPETLCRITYLGTENVDTKFGKKDVHQVRVEIDSEEEDIPTTDINAETNDLEPF